MSELFAAYRDGVGLHAKVLFDGTPVLIGELPPGVYDLFHGDELIADRIGPNLIPGFLLHYCTDLARNGYVFGGDTLYDLVNDLEVLARTSGMHGERA